MGIEQKDVIEALKEEIKLEKRPFLRIARELNIDEREVFARIEGLIKSGVVRYMGISVEPEKLGFKTGALVCWKVPPDRMTEIGEAFAGLSEVTHCYEREGPSDWPYRLFTMLHARDEEGLKKLIDGYKEKFGLKEFKIFKTVKKLKKSSINEKQSTGA
ncbi:MAG: hypothetical protein HQM08_05660 [Candidatus Riflebacteria bacterium]|nr:hypothetical protein [Candidatus Riflebacteria bacterium]